MNEDEVFKNVTSCVKELNDVLDKYRNSYGAIAMMSSLVKCMISNGRDKAQFISDIEELWDEYCEQ